MRDKMMVKMIDTCNALNDNTCQTALDGQCPRSTCEKLWEAQADDMLNAPITYIEKCGECEGSRQIEHDTGGVNPWGDPITALQPCPTCKGSGELTWQFEWEQELDTGGVTPSGHNIPASATKLLSHYDLADLDVAWAYAVINKNPLLDRPLAINNHKGILNIIKETINEHGNM